VEGAQALVLKPLVVLYLVKSVCHLEEVALPAPSVHTSTTVVLYQPLVLSEILLLSPDGRRASRLGLYSTTKSTCPPTLRPARSTRLYWRFLPLVRSRSFCSCRMRAASGFVV
jgi:hypothetical protein